MTLIVAYRDGNVILMASDSSSTFEINRVSIRNGNSKSWEFYIKNLGPCLLGFSGNFASGQAIRYAFKFPNYNSSESIESYLSSKVQPALQHFLSERFFPKEHIDYNKESVFSWELLFATNSRMFTISPCGDVSESVDCFSAIGDGAESALGALHALEINCSQTYSWEKLEIACSAAEKITSTVRKPFHILYNFQKNQ